MPVLDLTNRQIVADPASTVPFKPAPHPGGVTGDLDDLRPAAKDELAGSDTHEQVALNEIGCEVCAAGVFEPVAAADDVDLAVAVNVGLG